MIASEKQKAPRRQTEFADVEEQLCGESVEARRQAMRRVISAMNSGKEMSALFPAMLKSLETPQMEIKKLIYLYVSSSARQNSEFAALAAKSLRRDANDQKNPLLRGFALRTIGSLRLQSLGRQLVEPLRAALGDEDAYVRKSGVICVAKLYETDAALVCELGLDRVVAALRGDGNALVISNAICCLDAMAARGADVPPLAERDVARMLVALGEASEWSQTIILEAISRYSPSGAEAESALERIAAYLAHRNPVVVLSAVKAILRFAEFVTAAELARAYRRRVAPALVTLLSAEPEIRFVALKSIAIIAEKRAEILINELPAFFCRFNEPFFVKNEKIEILIKLANADNIDEILHEFRDYSGEIDIDFVRKAVRAIGILAVKVEVAADKCVQTLWECLKSHGSVVLQEAIIAIRDIFRRYPNEYDGLLAELCAEIKTVDEPAARAALAWIIGENVEQIENADEILSQFFIDSFLGEATEVQLEVLTAVVKLFLADSELGSPLVQRLFALTENFEDCDVRSRAFFYLRLLKAPPEIARKIVYSARAPIDATSVALPSPLVDALFEELNTLACVYAKLPKAFTRTAPTEAIAAAPPTEMSADLLGGAASDGRQTRIPNVEVVAAEHEGYDKKKSGLRISASIQLEERENMFLYLHIANETNDSLKNFFVKFRTNTYSLAPVSQEIPLKEIGAGKSATAKIPIDRKGPPSKEPIGFPMRIQVALNTSLDIFVFYVPFSIGVLFRPVARCGEQQFEELFNRPNAVKSESSLQLSQPFAPAKLISKLEDNNLRVISTQLDGQTPICVLAQLVDESQIPFRLTLRPNTNAIEISFSVAEPALGQLLTQSLKFILEY